MLASEEWQLARILVLGAPFLFDARCKHEFRTSEMEQDLLMKFAIFLVRKMCGLTCSGEPSVMRLYLCVNKLSHGRHLETKW
jgi:hypothetical protein